MFGHSLCVTCAADVFSYSSHFDFLYTWSFASPKQSVHFCSYPYTNVSVFKVSKGNCKFQLCPEHQTVPFWWVKIGWSRSIYNYPKPCKCLLISSLFFIRLAQACFFFRCGETVTKREQFNDLSIDLPRRKKFLPSRSIQDSLDLFFRVCTLRGAFMHCGMCLGYVPYGNSDCTADY